MGTPTTFERQEVKYLLTYRQRALLEILMDQHMVADAFGKSTILSLYYDTPNKQLIRHSLEKPVYKEKLRVRSYGSASPDSTVYVELKKKYNGIVYKRRVAMQQAEAKGWLEKDKFPLETSQITYEIEYFKGMFPLTPSMLLSCKREAFFGKNDADFRMTFDDNILWRDYDLCLCKGAYGEALLPHSMQLLEVKSPLGIPLWLAKFFSENNIFKTNYSKYGNAYIALCQKQKIGGGISA